MQLNEQIKRDQLKAIGRHKIEEERILTYMRENGGIIDGFIAKENISVIRRLWAQNKITSTGSWSWRTVR